MRSMLPQSRKIDGAVGHVGRRLVEDLLQRQEAVLDRQRELLRRQEHHRVLAELGEQVVHAQQRAERVAVGALVGGQQEAVADAQLGADPLESEAAGQRTRCCTISTEPTLAVGSPVSAGRRASAHRSLVLAVRLAQPLLVEQLRDPHACSIVSS